MQKTNMKLDLFSLVFGATCVSLWFHWFAAAWIGLIWIFIFYALVVGSLDEHKSKLRKLTYETWNWKG